MSLMKVEKVPDSTYDMVGGLDQQIKEIKEVRGLPRPALLPMIDGHRPQLVPYRSMGANLALGGAAGLTRSLNPLQAGHRAAAEAPGAVRGAGHCAAKGRAAVRAARHRCAGRVLQEEARCLRRGQQHKPQRELGV